MPETAFNYSSLAPANNPRPKKGRRARAPEQPLGGSLALFTMSRARTPIRVPILATLSRWMVSAVEGILTSPRASRGEVGAQRRVRGNLHESGSWRQPLTPTLSPRRAGRGRRGSDFRPRGYRA